jgi:hypothetical protein
MKQVLDYQNKKAAPERCFKKLPRERFSSTDIRLKKNIAI